MVQQRRSDRGIDQALSALLTVLNFSTYYSRVTPELSSFLIENEHPLVNDFVP